MPPIEHPACEWVEIGPDEDDETIICGKPAAGYALGSDGKRHYGCAEHAASVRAHHETGEWHLIPAHLPARPFPESMP